MAVTMPNTICRLLEEPSVWSTQKQREDSGIRRHKTTPSHLVVMALFVKAGAKPSQLHGSGPVGGVGYHWCPCTLRGSPNGILTNSHAGSGEDFHFRKALQQKAYRNWNITEGIIRVHQNYFSWHANSNQILCYKAYFPHTLISVALLETAANWYYPVWTRGH